MTEFIPTQEYSSLTQHEILDKFRILYYEILDHILMEMEVRFQDCEKLKFVCLVDNTKFEKYKSCFPSSELESLHEYFGPVIPKTQRLKNELALLYEDVRYRNISAAEVFKLLHEDKDIFMEAYKLFSLVLTLPSTTASVERSFSCLKRLKTYVRNTISQERLSSLANISIQKELLLQLVRTQPFFEDIIDKFAALKDRRINLIYKK